MFSRGYTPEGDGSFTWSDGILVQAMRSGGFLFIDEANCMPTRTLSRDSPLVTNGLICYIIIHRSNVIHLEVFTGSGCFCWGFNEAVPNPSRSGLYHVHHPHHLRNDVVGA